MKLTEEQIDGITVVFLEGEADAYNCNQIKTALGEIIEAGRHRVLIDLSSLSYMDSSAIGVLVAAKTSMHKQGGDLKVCSPTRAVVKVFEITRVGSFLEVHPDQAGALAAFGD
jgi:anti-sigma B factor antagonist